MIELHPITLKDKSWVDPLVWAEGSPSADFNFGNMFLWDNSFHQTIGELDDHLIVVPGYHPTPFFVWPIGKGSPVPVLRDLNAFARSQGAPLMLRGVTAEHLPVLEALWPGKYTVREDRDFWDYLYSAEKLDTLTGKALHGKRNHINRFEAENNWRFAPLAAADISECKILLDAWMEACGEDERDGIDDEYDALGRAFAHYDALELEGGVLRVDEKMVAFTIGEPISDDAFDVHFEKAHYDINGAYTMVNREFVRLIRARHPNIQWINREDDTGRAGLRQSKLSYYPEKMVEKYTVVIDDE